MNIVIAGKQFRPTFWPTLFTVPAVLVMLGLGTWQLERLAWKTALIERIERQLAEAPGPLPARPEALGALEYRRFTVTGRFLHAKEMLLAARSLRGNIGYQVITPLERNDLADGGWVLVNRGWVPQTQRDPANRAEGQVAGTVMVEGVVRVPRGQGWMQPDNRPEQNFWLWVDLTAMAKFAGLSAVAPVVLEAGPALNPGGLPIGGQARVELPNDHLQYAATWYILAVSLSVIFFLYHWRREEPAPQDL
ncbi:MAG: SURF1 family protein [Azospirillum sp.]|nr:SURF1 family protein [Azospirillum sp.]